MSKVKCQHCGRRHRNQKTQQECDLKHSISSRGRGAMAENIRKNSHKRGVEEVSLPQEEIVEVDELLESSTQEYFKSSGYFKSRVHSLAEQMWGRDDPRVRELASKNINNKAVEKLFEDISSQAEVQPFVQPKNFGQGTIDQGNLTGALKHKEAKDKALESIEQCEDCWSENGKWNRFLVTQSGHAHNSPYCSSLRVGTQYSWKPEYSGESLQSVTQKIGSTMCSKCFPDAPVDGLSSNNEYCDGSGERVEYNRKLAYPKGQCPSCSKIVAVTGTGVLRKHKP